MTSPTNHGLLRHAAHAARAREAFVAFALVAYQSAHDMGDEEMAAFLGCAPTGLPKLALCRRPDPAADRFHARVDEMATYAGVDRFRFARVLREADAVHAFRDRLEPTDTGAGSGLLLAARDRDHEESAMGVPSDAARESPSRYADGDRGPSLAQTAADQDEHPREVDLA